MSNQNGLYDKFTVTRTDGSDAPGGKHFSCRYFVLDLTHDQRALEALKFYADACRRCKPEFAEDLYAMIAEITQS